MLKLTVFGACDSVTGSCYLLETEASRVLIDCGMFQGGKELKARNERPFPFSPQDIDFVVLTHAHIDHSGLIPKLVRDGFKGEIIATRATASLCDLMLRDSAHIQETEAEWVVRKSKRAGSEPVAPLYTMQDAERALKLFRGMTYGASRELVPGMSLRFYDAGHILGSAITEFTVQQNGSAKKIVFSGDLGERGRPIIADPTLVEEADYVIVESTYGDRLHEATHVRTDKIRDIILQAIATKEKIIIPAFAVGRTQDVLYEINELYRAGEIPQIPVFIDSPLAISTTEVFKKYQEYYDDETKHRLRENMSPFDYPGLKFTRSVEDSKGLNEVDQACVIISASGMCEAGRIKHHLKHNLWRAGAHVLFVGYQAQGTLGRRIRDGEPYVSIFGEEIAIKAHIHAIEGLSAHADQQGLLWWMQGFKNKPQQVLVTHGEAESRTAFAKLLQSELGVKAESPQCNTVYDLLSGEVSILPEPIEEIEHQPKNEMDMLWQQATAALERRLIRGTKGQAREARKLAERMKNLLRQIIAKTQ